MKRFLLICVIGIIVMCSFSVISNATGVVAQGKEMEEGSSIFSDGSTILQDDFVIPNSTTYTVSRSRSVGDTVPTEAKLLNIRQTIPLSERQSMCATALVRAMRDYKNTVGVNVLQYALTNSEIKEVYASIRNTYPEFFYTSGRYGYYSYSVDAITYPAWDCEKLVEEFYPYFAWYDEVRYQPDVNAIDKAWGEIEYAVGQYNKVLRLDEQGDAGKLLTLHDYMIGLCLYDYEAIDSFEQNGVIVDDYIHAYDIYGILVNQKGVCSGYQLAYRYLLEQSGFMDVTYVVQDNHIWNAVKLGDYWYHVDLTSDDARPYGSSYHHYFLKSDDIFQESYGDYTSSVLCVDESYDSHYWDDITANFYYIGNQTYLYSDVDAISGSCMINNNGEYINSYKVYTTSDVLIKGVENDSLDTYYYFNVDGFGFRKQKDGTGVEQVYNQQATLLGDLWGSSCIDNNYSVLLSGCSGITFYDGKFYVSSTQSKMTNLSDINNWQSYPYAVLNHVYGYDNIFEIPKGDKEQGDTTETPVETPVTTEEPTTQATTEVGSTESGKVEIPTQPPTTEQPVEKGDNPPADTTDATTEDLEKQDNPKEEETKPSASKSTSKTSYDKGVKKPSIKSVQFVKKGRKTVIKMKKVGKKYKYQCQISKYKNFKKVYKTKTFSNTSYTFKKLAKGKYYVRVRLIKGKKHGKWSKIKTIKVK